MLGTHVSQRMVQKRIRGLGNTPCMHSVALSYIRGRILIHIQNCASQVIQIPKGTTVKHKKKLWGRAYECFYKSHIHIRFSLSLSPSLTTFPMCNSLRDDLTHSTNPLHHLSSRERWCPLVQSLQYWTKYVLSAFLLPLWSRKPYLIRI